MICETMWTCRKNKNVGSNIESKSLGWCVLVCMCLCVWWWEQQEEDLQNNNYFTVLLGEFSEISYEKVSNSLLDSREARNIVYLHIVIHIPLEGIWNLISTNKDNEKCVNAGQACVLNLILKIYWPNILFAPVTSFCAY